VIDLSPSQQAPAGKTAGRRGSCGQWVSAANPDSGQPRTAPLPPVRGQKPISSP